MGCEKRIDQFKEHFYSVVDRAIAGNPQGSFEAHYQKVRRATREKYANDHPAPPVPSHKNLIKMSDFFPEAAGENVSRTGAEMSENTMTTANKTRPHTQGNIFSQTRADSMAEAQSNTDSTAHMLRRASKRTPNRTKDFVNVMRVGNKINRMQGISQQLLDANIKRMGGAGRDG